MRNFWSGGRFAVLFSVLLTAFTAYALLDTFVIPRRYASAEVTAESLREETPVPQITLPQGTAETAPPQSATENVLSGSATESVENGTSASGRTKRRRTKGNSTPTRDTQGANSTVPQDVETAQGTKNAVIGTWSDENISITLTRYRAYDTDVYVADVTLSSPEYLKTALAGNVYGRNVKEKTSVTAAENHAVLAVNGDYYGARNSGYVIRNGVLYRESGAGGDVLAIFNDGSFEIVDDRQVTARELLDAGALQAFSFGPALLKDGTVTVTQGQEVGKAMASNPRTAIGVLGQLHYVFVVADGRTTQSAGMSLHELAEFLRGLGVETAYNLDGGGSSTMVFNGEIINRPTTGGNSVKERSVSDIVYIAP